MDNQRSVIDQIAQDARQLRKARMLPTDRSLTPQEIDDVAARFKAWLRETRTSAGAVGRMLGKGFGPSTIGDFIKGTRRNTAEAIARGVNDLMERHARSAEVPRPAGFVEIATAKRMLTVCKMAVDTGRMGEIVGPSGIGKSMVLRAAHAMYTGSLLINIAAHSRSATGFTREIARQLNISYRSHGALALGHVIDELKAAKGKRPIFIDEAHQAKLNALEVIRSIHDGAGCPIVICGTERLHEMVSDRARWFGQFNRRIVARVDLGEWLRSGPPSGGRVFSAKDIQRIFASERVRLTDDGAEFLSGIACLPDEGCLGLVETVVMIAGKLAQFQGRPITAKILLQVLAEMHGGAYLTLIHNIAEQRHIRLAVGAA